MSNDRSLLASVVAQELSEHDSPQSDKLPGAATTADLWSIKADWQPYSGRKWENQMRPALPPLGERAPHRNRLTLQIWQKPCD